MFTKVLSSAAAAAIVLQACMVTAFPLTISSSLTKRQDSGALPEKGVVSAWWGQAVDSKKLSELCAIESIDVVQVAFMNRFKAEGSDLPELNLGIDTRPADTFFQKNRASGLFNASHVATDIKGCQEKGKQVWISLGGSADKANTELKDEKEAEEVGNNIWNLFLGGTDEKLKPLRPFGDVVLDGVDFNTENGTPNHYKKLVEQLRKNMDSDTSKKYLISGTPQCPGHASGRDNGDKSLPDDVLKMMDIIQPQMYNNPACMFGADNEGFEESVKQWSEAFKDQKLSYAMAVNFKSAQLGSLFGSDNGTAKLKELNPGNFMGVSLWDAENAMAEEVDGKNQLDRIKESIKP